MPVAINYINFRATLPGEFPPNHVRNCMGYRFIGGKYEARIPEKDARTADRVLTSYFNAETEEVPNVVQAVSKQPVADKSPAKAAKADAPAADGKPTGDGAKAAAPKRGRPAKAGSGKTKRKTEGAVGPKGTSAQSGPDTSDLV